MYVWLWRHLPGALWMKLLWALLLFALVVVVLFGYVFPWAESYLPSGGDGSLSR